MSRHSANRTRLVRLQKGKGSTFCRLISVTRLVSEYLFLVLSRVVPREIVINLSSLVIRLWGGRFYIVRRFQKKLNIRCASLRYGLRNLAHVLENVRSADFSPPALASVCSVSFRTLFLKIWCCKYCFEIRRYENA